MSNVRFTNINGTEYSWANILFTFMGRTPAGIRSITYKEVQNMSLVYGTGQSPVGRAYGNIEPTASISMLFSELQKIKDISPSGKITDLTEFDILITYQPTPTKVVTDVLKDVKFKDNGVTVASGDEEMVVDIELSITDIEFGISPA